MPYHAQKQFHNFCLTLQEKFLIKIDLINKLQITEFMYQFTLLSQIVAYVILNTTHIAPDHSKIVMDILPALTCIHLF